MTNMKKHNDLPRREFLKQTGAWSVGAGLALAGPSLFLNRTRAQTGESPSEFIGVGVIGTGGQGTYHLNAPSMSKHVVAVCDVDAGHLARARKAVQDRTGRTPATYRDYRQLLASKEVDAVLIATPDHWHALLTVNACEAGKDVYCEKPLTLVIREGSAMVKAARDHKRIVQTGSQQRSDAKFRRGCEYVRSGRIGDIRAVRVGIPGVNWMKDPPVPDSAPPPELDYNLWLGPAPERPYNRHRVHYYFRFFWDYSGGQMTNWGAHHLDIAQWGLGMDTSGPVEVAAHADYDPQGRFETPVWFECNYTYANGIKLNCGMSFRIGTTFEGQDGILFMDRGKLESTVKGALAEPLGPDEVHLYVSGQHHQNWFDCIKSRQLPICDVAIGHRSATVCHLGNLAVRLKRKIRWDPVKEEIIDDPEASRHLSYAYRAPWHLPGLEPA